MRCGTRLYAAVDALGEPLTLQVTPTTVSSSPRWQHLAVEGQAVTRQTVELGFIDHGSTGEQATADAAAHGIRLEGIKLEETKRGFALLPRRWVVERSFAWAARFRRLAKEYERLPDTVASLHCPVLGALGDYVQRKARQLRLLQSSSIKHLAPVPPRPLHVGGPPAERHWPLQQSASISHDVPSVEMQFGG
jgi:transposase